MLSNYQLKITHLYNILVGNVKKLEPNLEAEKNEDKYGKALHKLMNNAIYGKTMENVRNRINVRLASNEKGYLKSTSKPSYMLQNISR